MKTSLLSLTALTFAVIAQAQQSPTVPHRCLYDHAVMQREGRYPGYKAAADASFLDAQALGELLARQGHRSVYTVPVAVHVVWKEAAENLSECKIIEQIDILNEDYQRLNADTANLRAIFAGVAGNPQIQFRLDTIIWKQTTATFGSAGPFPDIDAFDNVKSSSTGGSDALATTDYLNIWVCSLGNSGVLGYAYPPAGLSHWPADSDAPTPEEDGVVLDYRIIGRSGEYSIQGTTLYTQGRAATHEVGHYLGLRHIWGDGFGAIFGVPDCNATDGVNDTPTQGMGSNFACNPNQNTCGAGSAGDLPDMIENYMDYSEESCQNTFTIGQVAIQHGVLSNERAGLANTPAPVNNRPANDALPHAAWAQVNLDTTCTLFSAVNLAGATPSMAPCAPDTTAVNDVWYQFTAPAPNLVLELSNFSTNMSMLYYQILGGSCGDLTPRYCGGMSDGGTDMAALTGLNSGETYFIRMHSATALQAEFCIHALEAIVGVETLDKANDLRIYPNPSSGLFTVEWTGTANEEGALYLYNALGQQIAAPMAWQGANQRFQLDLTSQTAGIYWVELRSNNGRQALPVIIQ